MKASETIRKIIADHKLPGRPALLLPESAVMIIRNKDDKMFAVIAFEDLEKALINCEE